jgi:hypothetical protein
MKAIVIHCMLMAAATTTTKPKKTKVATPNRTRSVGLSVRLSPEEHKDLQAVIKAWQDRAREQGYTVEGFGAWLRAIIHREKEALSSR